MAHGYPADSLLVHDAFLRSLASALLFEPSLADDAVQDAWLVALMRAEQLSAAGARAGESSPNPERAWLARVVRNLASRLRRGAARRTRHEAAAARRDLASQSPGPAEIAAREATRRDVVQALLELDEPYREVIILRYYEGLSPRAIARRDGTPVETIRTRIKRGIQRLRERLDANQGRDARQGLPLLLFHWATRRGNGWTRVPPPRAVVGAASLLIAVSAVVVTLRLTSAARAGEGLPPLTVANSSAGLADARGGSERDDRSNLPPIIPIPFSTRHQDGLVRAPDGTPVPQASVWVRPYVPFASIGLSDRAQNPTLGTLVHTDGHGRFDAPCDGAATLLTVTVEAAGFAPAVVEGVTGQRSITVVLPAAIRLSGQVHEDGGQTIAGATIDWSELIGTSRIERHAVSGPDGRYELTNLPGDITDDEGRIHSWQVIVRAAGFAATSFSAPFMRATDLRDGVHDIVLHRGGRVHGSAIDALTHAAIANARVVVVSTLAEGWTSVPDTPPEHSLRGAFVVGETRTDERGAFAFASLPLDAETDGVSMDQDGRRHVGRLILAAAGYAPVVGAIAVGPDETDVTVDLIGHRPATIEGRVVDDGGNPIPGLSVGVGTTGVLSPRDTAYGFDAALSHTDEHGHFSLADVSQPTGGGALSVRVCGGREHDDVLVEAKPAPGAALDLGDVTVSERPSISVAVVDPDGHPVEGARVLTRVDGIPFWSGADGVARVCVPTHEAGPTRLIVRATGFAPAVTDPLTPARHDPPRVTVRLLPPCTLSGHVIFEDGSPAGGIPVTVTAAGDEDDEPPDHVDPAIPPSPLRLLGRTTSRNDGSFVVDGLAAGTCCVSARVPVPGARGMRIRTSPAGFVFGLPNFTSSSREVATDSQEVVLRLPVPADPSRATSLEGEVVDAETDAPVVAFEAVLRSQNGASMRHGSHASPRFRFDGLADGAYTLTVATEDRVTTEPLSIEVRRGEPVPPLTVRLARGATCHGTIRSSTGPIPPSARLHFVAAGFFLGPKIEVEPDGRFTARGLRPGVYRVVATPAERGPRRGFEQRTASGFQLVVPPGATEIEQDVTISPPASIQVTVKCPRLEATSLSIATSADRQRLEAWPKCRMVILDARDFPIWERFAPDVFDRMTYHVPAGTVRVRVEIAGAAPEERTVTIAPGQSTAVKFEFP